MQTRRSFAVLGVALGLALAGCGGDAEPTAAAPAAPAAPAQPAKAAAVVEQLPPAAFAKRIDRGDGMLINVHVPNEGEIPGTDAHISYLDVLGSARLPADKDRELLLYCRSGRMSTEAGRNLVAAGYTKVVELAGGFEAWKESGRTLTPAPA